MKNCKHCGRRDVCVRVCPALEKNLPDEDTGRDRNRELLMSPDGIEIAANLTSYAGWVDGERAATYPAPDFSVVTGRERQALGLLALGLSQRDAAGRMKISRFAFRTLTGRAFAKLRVAHSRHTMNGRDTPKEAENG